MKLITGNDNVDSWQKHTWDAILTEARMVVSTPQVLYDALAHAYLRMSDLSLIVIDEGLSTPSSGNRHRLTLIQPTTVRERILAARLCSTFIIRMSKQVVLCHRFLDFRLAQAYLRDKRI
jgi:hypothetical protein